MTNFWSAALAALIGQKDLQDKADALLSVCSKLQDEVNVLREEYINLLDAAGRSGAHPWAKFRLASSTILKDALDVPGMFQASSVQEIKKKENKDFVERLETCYYEGENLGIKLDNLTWADLLRLGEKEPVVRIVLEKYSEKLDREHMLLAMVFLLSTKGWHIDPDGALCSHTPQHSHFNVQTEVSSFCKWVYLEDECNPNFWVAECPCIPGDDKRVTGGGLEGLRFLYCPYCGKQIKKVQK